MSKFLKATLLSSVLLLQPVKASWEAFALTTAGAASTALLAALGDAWRNPEQARARCLALMCCCRRDPDAESRVARFYPDSMPWETARMVNRVANALEAMCSDSRKTMLADGMAFETSTFVYEIRRGLLGDPDPLELGPTDSTDPATVERVKNSIKRAARLTGRFQQEFFERVEEAVRLQRLRLVVRTETESGREDLYALLYAGVDPLSGEGLNFVVHISPINAEEVPVSAVRSISRGGAALTAADAAHPAPMPAARLAILAASAGEAKEGAAHGGGDADAMEAAPDARRVFRTGTFMRARLARLAAEARERLEADGELAAAAPPLAGVGMPAGRGTGDGDELSAAALAALEEGRAGPAAGTIGAAKEGDEA